MLIGKNLRKPDKSEALVLLSEYKTLQVGRQAQVNKRLDKIVAICYNLFEQ